ncbi:MAG: hypothetical protein WKG06_36185 [Segetibacter sp.]
MVELPTSYMVYRFFYDNGGKLFVTECETKGEAKIYIKEKGYKNIYYSIDEVYRNQ